MVSATTRTLVDGKQRSKSLVNIERSQRSLTFDNELNGIEESPKTSGKGQFTLRRGSLQSERVIY